MKLSRLSMMMVPGPTESSIVMVRALREDPTGLQTGGDSKLVWLLVDVEYEVGWLVVEI